MRGGDDFFLYLKRDIRVHFSWGDIVKKLFGFAVICTCVCGMTLFAGCSSGNNQGTMPSLPEVAEGAAGAGQLGTPQPPQIDSASNGGSSLAAAAPYAGDGKGGAVQQNINAAPFLQASTPMKTGMALPAVSGALVSRADGTMYGPTDMSPAGAGPGTQGMTSSGSAANQSGGAKSTTGAVPAGQTNKNAAPK
jgi:hypothetical protein